MSLHCELDLENNNLIFTQNTPVYDNVPSNKIWLQKDQKFRKYGRKSNIWLYEPSLWPWTWRKQTNLLTWHFDPRCCITITSLVTEGSAVEDTSPRWTFSGILNLSVTLAMTTTKQSNLFTRQPSLSWCTTKTKLQKDQQLRRYIRKSYYNHMILNCDINHEVSKPIFLGDSLAHRNASEYQAGWKKVK